MHSSSAQGSLAGEVSEASLASQGEVLGHTHLNCPEVGIEVSCSRLRELFGHQRRYARSSSSVRRRSGGGQHLSTAMYTWPSIWNGCT